MLQNGETEAQRSMKGDTWATQRQHPTHRSAPSSLSGSGILWEIGGILWKPQEQGREKWGREKPIAATEKVLQMNLRLKAGEPLARGRTLGSGGTGSHFGVPWQRPSLTASLWSSASLPVVDFPWQPEVLRSPGGTGGGVFSSLWVGGLPLLNNSTGEWMLTKDQKLVSFVHDPVVCTQLIPTPKPLHRLSSRPWTPFPSPSP